VKEADVQTKFNQYVKARWPKGRSAAFELKIVKGLSLPFSNVQEHQVAGLLASKIGKLVYKIPDAGLGKKPFDSMVLSETEAYVVAIFYRERQYTKAYLIDVEVWVTESETSSRASLTEERAQEIASDVFILKESYQDKINRLV
jgi:hypothetical protein